MALLLAGCASKEGAAPTPTTSAPTVPTTTANTTAATPTIAANASTPNATSAARPQHVEWSENTGTDARTPIPC